MKGKKDVVFSMRMSSRVRQALQLAAARERRSVASLIDKIMVDYLTAEGYLPMEEFGGERRRFPRKKTTLPARALLQVGDRQEILPGVVLDISAGGVRITCPKGSEVTFSSEQGVPKFQLCLQAPGQDRELCFECDVRHVREAGDSIQLGATFHNLRGDDVAALRKYLM